MRHQPVKGLCLGDSQFQSALLSHRKNEPFVHVIVCVSRLWHHATHTHWGKWRETFTGHVSLIRNLQYKTVLLPHPSDMEWTAQCHLMEKWGTPITTGNPLGLAYAKAVAWSHVWHNFFLNFKTSCSMIKPGCVWQLALATGTGPWVLRNIILSTSQISLMWWKSYLSSLQTDRRSPHSVLKNTFG